MIILIVSGAQTNLIIALQVFIVLGLFWHFINTSAHHWADTSLHLPLAVALPGHNCNEMIAPT